jgi:hypothetical protein
MAPFHLGEERRRWYESHTIMQLLDSVLVRPLLTPSSSYEIECAISMAFLTDPWSVLFSSIVFVTAYLGFKTAAREYGPPNSAGRLMTAHNYAQVLVSLIILSLTVVASLPFSSSLILQSIRADDAYIARLAYHYSKFYEYCDIFLVAVQGKPVGLHFFFHHLTTPWFTIARVIHAHEGWQLFAGLNAFHHALSERPSCSVGNILAI